MIRGPARCLMLVVLVLVLAGAGVLGCSIREAVTLSVVGDNEHYLWSPRYQGTALEPVSAGVWSFRWTWYRNLVVKTDEGLFVTDPFNPAAARAMRAALDSSFPGVPVHTLFNTHYHLDHARGGAALGAKNIIAHQDCPSYWADFEGGEDVATPTELIAGDKTLIIGGTEIQLLHLPRSHGGDTLYAVYLPQQRLLHTADLGIVKTIAPLGVPDSYMPGYLRALDRVGALDVDVWVPAHFSIGHKADLLDSTAMLRTLIRLVREAHDQYQDADGNVPDDAATLKARFKYVHDGMAASYSTWFGFDEQMLFNIVRGSTGELLGF